MFGLHFIEAIFYLKKFSTISTTEMTNLIMNIGKSRISPLYEVATTAIPGSVSPLLSSQEIRKPVNKMLYQNHPFHKYQAPEWKLSNSTWALGKSGPSNSFGLTAIAGIGGDSSIFANILIFFVYNYLRFSIIQLFVQFRVKFAGPTLT